MNTGGIFLFLGLLFCAAAASGAEYGFFVESAEVGRSDSGYRLNADIDYRFSSRAADALKHGVPLTLVVKVRVNRYRRFIWNKGVFSRNMIYRLSYHPLRKRYRVYDDSLGTHRYFVGLDAAVEAMGQIRDLQILAAEEVVENSRYDVQIKVLLDIESLPLPLRSVAYLIPQLHISSSWYSWSLEELSRR